MTQATPRRSRLARIATRLGWAVVWLCVLAALLWGIGAVYFLTYLPRWLSTLLALTYLTGFAILLPRTRPKRRWLWYAAFSWFAVYLLTLVQQPSHDRDWATDHSRMPTIEITNGDVTIHDFRSFRYQTETKFEPAWRDFRFRLSQVTKVWFGVQRFTSLEGIAHTFLCFEIGDQDPEYVCVSVEIRREVDEDFSPIKGLYRQYELIYVVSDERDEVVMRTVHRPQDRVYLFPVNADAKHTQQLFVDIADRINGLGRQPEFYNSITSNCTNNIAAHTRELDSTVSTLDWRILIPGYSDRFAWAKGFVGQPGEPFEAVRDRWRIDQAARQFGDRDGFSQAIRLAP